MIFARNAMANSENAGPSGPIDSAYVDRLRTQGDILEDEDLSVLFDRLVFVQASRGYRFGADSVVLAHYASSVHSHSRMILDVGTGCGVMAILLASELPQTQVFAVEVQYMMADRAMRNTALNEVCGRVMVYDGDIADFVRVAPPGSFDLIVSNPPFYREGSGRVNPDGERAIARHELRLTMDGLLSTVSTLLAPEGHAVILYPAERLDECLTALARFGLFATALVPLLAAPDQPVESYIIDIVPQNPSCPDTVPEVAPPLFLNRSSE